MEKYLVLLLCCIANLSLMSCQDIDRLDTNTYINEETTVVQSEYIFKVISIEESSTYNKDDIEYDSTYENGVFLILNISVRRKTLENSNNLDIEFDWFKLKKGVGFTAWSSSLGETILANSHIEPLESSLEIFTVEQGETIKFLIVFDLGENYIDTERVLTLEVDKPWTSEGAKEIVLIDRPEE